MSLPVEQLAGRSAAAIARALAAGEASPVALVEHCLERVARQASPVFLAVTAERAREEARAAEARLAAGRPASALDGVPIAWKDLVDMVGVRTTAASDLRREAEAAERDAPIVASVAAAGLPSLGKLNLTEFAYSGLGLNPHYGTPVNPCDPTTPRAPGGSSSGSAVAVASGLAPLAVGTDTGGSVRIPAAFNGIVGYKSSEGRVPVANVFPLCRTLDTVGPLARTVEDCVLLDMALRGVPSTPVRRVPPREIVVHVPVGIVLDDLEPAVAANFEASLRRLEAAGAKIRSGPLSPIETAVRLAGEIGSITAAEAYAEHRALVDGPDVGRVDRRVVARMLGGKRMSAADLILLHRTRAEGMAALRAALDGAFLAMPTVSHVAPEIAPLEADDDLFHRVNLKTLRNTMVGNFLNLPGLAIPNGTGAGGMPTSILLSAPGGGDDRLLAAGLGAEEKLRGETDA